MNDKIVWASIAIFIIFTIMALVSCNVTRTVTTTSTCVRHGDTTTTIQTKTVESYDAVKRPL